MPEKPSDSESRRFDPIHITLISCPDTQISDVRRSAVFFLKTLALCAEDVYDIEVIISELVTNVTIHACASICQIDIDVEPAHVTITVTDDGCGFDPNHIPCPGARRPDTICPPDSINPVCTRVGGYGLPLVRSLSRSLDVAPCEGGGAKVRVKKNLCQRVRERTASVAGAEAMTF